MAHKYGNMPIDSVTAMIRAGTQSLTVDLADCTLALYEGLTKHRNSLKAQIKNSTGHDVVIEKVSKTRFTIRRSHRKGAQ